MDAFFTLFEALRDLGMSFLEVFTALAAIVIPWTPLIAWLAYWMFAVNWIRLREVLVQGGWIGLLLLMTLAVLVWGSVSSPPSGAYELFGLRLSNFVGKTVFVTGLTCLMLLAGSLQLSGFCSSWCHFEEPAPDEGDHGHGHDSHALQPAHH